MSRFKDAAIGALGTLVLVQALVFTGTAAAVADQVG